MTLEETLSSEETYSDAEDSEILVKALDGSRFYQWGATLRAVVALEPDATSFEVANAFSAASHTLLEIKDCGLDLPNITSTREELFNLVVHKKEEVGSFDPAQLQACISEAKQRAQRFEHVLQASMEMCPTFHLAPKKAFDTRGLVNEGLSFFPDDLPGKVPEAVNDLKSGMRCIALELFTAAAFHLHRANEAVVRAYYAAVSNDRPMPARKNPDYRPSLGDYLAVLRDGKMGDERLVASLQSLKDLHRNFIAHPDLEITDIDEIAALAGQINSAIYYMLKEIPDR